MGDFSAIDQRLTDLEIKASYSEDLVEQLNQVIVRQQQQIDALINELARRQQPSQEAGGAVSRNYSDDLPPHY